MNLVERTIAEAASLEQVRPGDQVVVCPSYYFLYECNLSNIMNVLHKEGYKHLAFPERVYISRVKTEHSQTLFHSFVEFFKIPLKQSLLDKETMDIDSQSRSLITGCDPRVLGLGGLGVIPILVPSTLLARNMAHGYIHLTVPEILYLSLNGTLKRERQFPDLIHYLYNQFQSDGLLGMGIIIGGNTTCSWSASEKMQFAEAVVEMGGLFGVVAPSGPEGQVEKIIKIQLEQI